MLLERLFENLAVTVEAFATCEVALGWRLRLPRLEGVTFHFVLQGHGTLKAGGGATHPLAPRTLAVVPPNAPHSIECGPSVLRESKPDEAGDRPAVRHILAGPVEEAELFVACGRVRVTYGEELGLFDQLRDVIVLDFSDSEQMASVFDALLHEWRSEAEASQAMLAALMNQCLVLVFRRLSAHCEGSLPWLAALEDPRLAAALETILERPGERHSLESLASAANMSRSLFAKRFHDSFGRTPMRYVRDVRLRRAARLLRHSGQLSVEAVARRVGFDSRSQFSRAFQSLFGSSPSEFRAGAAS